MQDKNLSTKDSASAAQTQPHLPDADSLKAIVTQPEAVAGWLERIGDILECIYAQS